MENLNETKAMIYNNLLKDLFDIISQDCKKEGKLKSNKRKNSLFSNYPKKIDFYTKKDSPRK